jgi:hypothetical protein
MALVSTERLADVFVEVADTLVDDYDVIEFLHLVTNRTAELIGASDVGLLLADQRGRLEFMAASNEDVERLELFQLQNHEGPCLDAFRGGEPVVNADLEGADDRWPRFAPRAAARSQQHREDRTWRCDRRVRPERLTRHQAGTLTSPFTR